MRENTWNSIVELTGRLAPSRAQALRTLLEDLFSTEYDRGFNEASAGVPDSAEPEVAQPVRSAPEGAAYWSSLGVADEGIEDWVDVGSVDQTEIAMDAAEDFNDEDESDES